MPTERASSDDYEKDFDPVWYNSTFYDEIGNNPDQEINEIDQCFGCYIDYIERESIKSKVLLDFGSGPCIHSVISASKHTEKIYLAEYSSTNRAVLQAWRDGDSTLQEHVCKYILSAEKSSESVSERYQEMRDKLVDIVPCNVYDDPPVKINDTPDLITTSLCLEAGCKTLDDYNNVVNKLSNILAPGGHIIVFGVLEETYYQVGKYNFPCLSLKKEDLLKVYNSHGLRVLRWKEQAILDEKYADQKGVFSLLAVKA